MHDHIHFSIKCGSQLNILTIQRTALNMCLVLIPQDLVHFTDWSVKCDSIHDFESLIKCNFMVNKERKLIDEILFLMYA